MSFFKHVGQANNKKVIIVQRQIPGEEHMAAVLYSDILPTRYHDDVMQILESPEGAEVGLGFSKIRVLSFFSLCIYKKFYTPIRSRRAPADAALHLSSLF
jgi:hypothetical protein